MAQGEETKCFICDGFTSEPYNYLIEMQTEGSKVSIVEKISSLIGDNFLVVLNNDDALCDQCVYLVNEMDKLEEQLTLVKDVVSNFLFKKYNIGTNEQVPIRGTHEDGGGRVKKQLQCDYCAYSTDCEEEMTNHCKIHQENVLDSDVTSVCTVPKKVFKCGVCSKIFDAEDDCRIHINDTHLEVGQLPNAVDELEGKNNCFSSDPLVKKEPSTVDSVRTEDSILPRNGIDKETASRTSASIGGSDQTYECQFCGSSFPSLSILIDHAKDHDESDDEVSFLSEMTSRRHWAHTSFQNDPMVSKPRKQYTCHVCRVKLNSKIGLKRHLKSHKSSKRKSITKTKAACTICGVKTCSDKEHYEHLKEHFFVRKTHDVKEGLKRRIIFHCKSCGDQFPSSSEMFEHFKAGHKNVQYTCESCSADFTSETELAKHLKIHRCKCTFCNKHFPSELKLREHAIVHSAKIAPSQCEYCLLSFNYQSLLDFHVREDHNDVKLTKCCPLCGIKSPTLYALKRHVVKCHLITNLQKEIRDSSADVEAHQQTSSIPNDISSGSQDLPDDDVVMLTVDEYQLCPLTDCSVESLHKHFMCKVCAFAANSFNHMKQHLKSHILNMPCFTCSAQFEDYKDLVIHAKEEHCIMLNASFCLHCFNIVDQTDIKEHFKLEHMNIYGSLVCFICGEQFFDKSSIKEHVEEVHTLSSATPCLEVRLNGPGRKLESPLDSFLELALRYMKNSDTRALNSANQPVEIESLLGSGEEPSKSPSGVSLAQGSQEKSPEHLADFGFVCEKCLKQCSSQPELVSHMEQHAPVSLNLTCPHCKNTLYDNIHLQSHLESKHPEQNVYYCKPCDQPFLNRSLYVNHNQTAHVSRENMVCDQCGKKFNVLKRYLYHKEYAHRPNMNCKHCGKTFGDNKKLRIHESIHQRKSGKTLKCDLCVKTFKTPSGLRFHRLSHTGNYPFYCEYCGKGYASNHHLQEHLARHTGEERYVCDVCGRRFRFYDTYYRHRNLHDNPYPKQCDICQKSFRNASRVAEHRRKVHTGERPYKCPFCPMTFNISSSYKVHVVLHTKAYPYKCDLCSRGFTTRIKYGNHMATKHEDYSIVNNKKPNYKQVFPADYVVL